MTDTATTTAAPSRWPRWLTKTGAALGIGAPVLTLLSALATGWGMIGWEASLGALRPLLLVGAVGLLLSLIALVVILVKKQRHLLKWALLGALAGGAFLAYAVVWFNQLSSVPPIHDVTTDLSNPPAFETLELRTDNREIVPDGGRADLAELDNAMRWREWHEEAYADIQPVVLNASVPAVIAAAEELMEDRGWEIAVSDPATGHIEATETVSLYGFKDDVVLRVEPNPNATSAMGSIVHMRSVSRVGVSDLGVNAERIRAFLADLSAAVGS